MNENRLLNLNEDIPQDFFVFVNFKNVVTEHNLRVTKTFTSGAFAQLHMIDFAKKYIANTIDYLPFIPNPSPDVKILSIFNVGITSEYRTEYNAELSRKYNFPNYPSRLSAVYAFGDKETCRIVSNKYHWDINTVRRFRLNPNPLNKVVKVNMEIVSLERHANSISMMNADTINNIWQSYWTGFGNIVMELPIANGGRKEFHSEVIWEYLIEGQLILIE